MFTHHNDQKSGERPNKRNFESTPKADALPVSDPDEQTEDQPQQDALDASLRHPNRSHDKSERDKPAYGGGH